MTVATRYLGTCPVCYREQKLHKMAMVHHGYQRPGYGYIQGDCFGVGWAPFELSPDGTIAYVERVLQPMLERLQAFLSDLQAGIVTELYVTDYSVTIASLGRRGERPLKKITPADGYAFEQEVRNKIRSTGSTIGQLTRDIAERTELVRKWRKEPIRTENEVLQQRARITDERRAVIDQARAAKQAKRAALDAKQQAREQERLDLIAEYRDIFEHLATRASSHNQQVAKEHWVKMHKRMNKKGYLHFYPHKLEAADALVRLGLAIPVSYGTGHQYSNDMGWPPTK